MMARDDTRATAGLIHLLLAALVGLLFLGAHADGSYWWSDAPRHALNGVFVKDLVAAAPWSDPSRYAYDYYAQYPALTILFYPPLFYAISAPFYALFGVSEGTALLVVALHYVAFAWGAWALFRCWLPSSRYQPANLPGMEIYRRQPAELGWETFDIDCAVPVVAL